MLTHRRLLACIVPACLFVASPCVHADTAAAASATSQDPRTALLVSTDALRTMGLESAWQTALPMVPGVAWQGAKSSAAAAQGGTGSIYGWDAAGALISLDAATGVVRWQSAGLGRSERVVDVLPATIEGRELAIMLGAVNFAAIDSKTGEIAGFSDYREIPSTPATMFGAECIYGSASRKLVWTRFESERIPPRAQPKIRPGVIREVPAVSDVGSRIVMRQIRATQMLGTLEAAPVGGWNDALMVTTSRGEVMCVNKDLGSVQWKVRLAGGVVATPCVAGGMLYVGSQDQYLRAFDIASGRTLWKWFAPAELDHPPIVAADLLLVQVPESGLAALRAANASKPDGDLAWLGDKVRGNPITRNREGILCWDAPSSTLSLVDDRTGGVRSCMQLPGITTMWASAPLNGNLVMLSSDGRVQHCRVTAPLATEAPKPTAVAVDASATAPEAGSVPDADAPAPTGDEATKPDA